MSRHNDGLESLCEDGVIDWKVLGVIEELRGPGEPDMRPMLIKLYLESSFKLIKTVKTAIRENDVFSLSNAAHSLKSASVQMGAARLGFLCGELDRLARSGVLTDAPDLFRQVEDQHEAVVSAMKEALPLFPETS